MENLSKGVPLIEHPSNRGHNLTDMEIPHTPTVYVGVWVKTRIPNITINIIIGVLNILGIFIEDTN
jgi:hypothetical protein